MSEKNLLESIGPLPYALMKTLEACQRAWTDAIEEYSIYTKNNNFSDSELIARSMNSAAEELAKKYNLSIDDVVNLLPECYRPYANVAKKMPWPYVVDFAANFFKEMGKDSATGQYKTTEEVFTTVLKKTATKKILSMLIGSR